MQKRIFIAVILVGTVAAAAAAYAFGTSSEDFVRKASVANEFEIESSQLALDKSQNGDVKSFAQQMIDDHTKTGETLKETLQSSPVQEKPAVALDNKHQKLLDKLESAAPDKFDDQYITMQTKAHKEAVSLFKSYTKHGKDAALKNFATETLPTLQAHLQHAEQLKANH